MWPLGTVIRVLGSTSLVEEAGAAPEGAVRRGFTLIELAYVLAIIALLTAVTVPAYDAILRRARVTEAHAMVHAIAHAELRHLRDRGSYLACPATGELSDLPAPFPDEPCWRALGIRAEGEVRFRWGVELVDDSFVVTGQGDQDGDGELTTFRLDGRTFALQIEDELE